MTNLPVVRVDVLLSEIAPPNSTPLVLLTIVNVCPNLAVGVSPSDFTFLACSFLIFEIGLLLIINMIVKVI